MNLSKNSWHYALYRFTYNYYSNSFETVNFCNYFWKLVIALIILPFTIPCILFFAMLDLFVFETKTFTKDLEGKIVNDIPAMVKVIFSFAVYVFLMFLYWCIIMLSKEPVNFLICFGIIAVLTGLLVLLFKKRDNIDSKLYDFSQNVGEISSIIKTRFVSFKERHCPKINWK